MKILITGGSGFIGTNLLGKFVKDGYDVVNIDFQKPRNMDFEKYWRNIDITNFNNFKLEVNSFNPDYIVHLAARTDLNGSSLNDYSANTLGVENLMKLAKNLQSLKKILITSSMLVCELGYQPKDEFDFNPSTIYGESKVMTEKNVRENPPSCDWSIIRPTSIWGPWFRAPYKSFFDMIIDKKYFHIGNVGCTKTYGYIENAIYQIEKILFTNTIQNKNKVFYLGDYEETNIELWADKIGLELGFSIKKVPYFLVKFLAFFGDILKIININFPMTSFRLKNMTTNNIIDLSNTKEIAPNLPSSRENSIKQTLSWLKTQN
jgi:nucleoside-diphosphate-sugar epimerase